MKRQARKWTFFTLLAAAMVALFTGCAPVGESASSIPRDSTGLKNDKGLDYLNGGDPRVTKRVYDEQESGKLVRPAPMDDGKSRHSKTDSEADKSPTVKILRERLIAFSIVRYDKNSNSPTRMGKDRIETSIYVRRDDGQYDELKFSGKLGGPNNNRTFGPLTAKGFSQYQLKGNLNDRNDKVWGLWTLTDSSKKQTADIYYRAYKTKNTVMVNDEDPDVETKFAEVLAELRNNTFGWVSNWVVAPGGRSYYLTDIVQTISKNKTAGIYLTFSGESVRTGTKVQPDQPVQVSKSSEANFEMEMVGDAGDKGKRTYEVTLKDPKLKENSRILVSMDEENPEPTPAEYVIPAEPEATSVEDSESTIEQGPFEENNQTGETEQADAEQADAEPVDAQQSEKPDQGNNPDQPVVAQKGSSYFNYDSTSAKIRKILADFNSNSSASIDKFISHLTKKTKDGKDTAGRRKLTNFFANAFYLRPLIETIGNYYDVSAVFVYITAVESHYLKGNFSNREVNKGSTATGPYQILDDTAEGLGLNISKGEKGVARPAWDERHYFAPASCAAAKYISEIADGFKGDRDKTFAILGYYTGPYTNLLKRVKRLAAYKGNRYDAMAEGGAFTRAQRNYVDEVLAAFKVGNDPAAFGFNTKKGNKGYEGTLFPAGGISAIKSAKCREAVSSAPSI